MLVLMRRKYNLCIKIMAVIVCIAFSFANIAFALADGASETALRVPLTSGQNYIGSQRLTELQERYKYDSVKKKYLEILAQVRSEHIERQRQGLDDETMLTSLDAVRIVELCNESDMVVAAFITFCRANNLIDAKLERFINQTLERERYRTYPEEWNEEAFNRLAVDVLHVLSRRLHDENISLKERVYKDRLTGLRSREYFDEKIPELLKLAKKRNVPVSMIIIDADKFKGINDEYGHDVGDLVLRYIANNILRSSDAIVPAIRLGGEEFVLVLPGASLEGAMVVAERIRRDIYIEVDNATGEAVIHIGEKEVRVKREISASLGVACMEGESIARYSEISDVILSLYQRADVALYFAKEGGRNQVQTDADVGLQKFMADALSLQEGLEFSIIDMWPNAEQKTQVGKLLNIVLKVINAEWKRLGINRELEIVDRDTGIVEVKVVSPTSDLIENSATARDQI